MAKSKKNNSSTAVGLVNGSMAVAKAAAKVRNVTRKRMFLAIKAPGDESLQVLSGSQSMYPTGTQFTTETLLFSADQLSNNAESWIQSHDRYRISQIEVFATLNTISESQGEQTLPVECYFYEDTDADPATQTSWIRLSDRENVGRVVLTKANPSQRLISFKPTVSFAAGAVSQAPSNVIPKKDQWLDAVALAQVHAGLRIFTCCGQKDASARSYAYHVRYQVRYHIEAQQPI